MIIENQAGEREQLGWAKRELGTREASFISICQPDYIVDGDHNDRVRGRREKEEEEE